MKFEEQFPSLHLKTWNIGLETDVKSNTIYGQRTILRGDDSGKYIKTSDVVNNCIDKQKVKEVIKTCININATPSYVSVKVYEQILKELGLEE